MGRSKEYSENSDECVRQSRLTTSLDDKAAWLRQADTWLRMIREPNQVESDKFDAAEAEHSTHQTPSDAEH